MARGRSAGSRQSVEPPPSREEGYIIFSCQKLVKNMEGSVDKCLWRPSKRRKTKMDVFREYVNKKYGKNLGMLLKHEVCL